MAIAEDNEQHQHHIVDGLQHHITDGVAPGQHHVGHGERDGLDIHGKDRDLGHGNHRQELRAEQQRNKYRETDNQCSQHRRHNEQRHLYLTVHSQIGSHHIAIHGRQTGEIVGLHR